MPIKWNEGETVGQRIQDMENFADQAQPLKLQAAAIRSLPTLSFGDSGDSVKVLQRLLSQNGYPVRADGNFGALTETAVKAFQSQHNLTVDGVVGSRTWRELTR